MLLYMAGPLFTPYERAFLADNATKLRALGFQCFVPHEEQVFGLTDSAAPTSGQAQVDHGSTMAERIFAKDFAAVQRSHALVALLDGPNIDDGTACEVGLFYGLMQSDPSKLGILGILTDARAPVASENHGLNLYVLGCIQRVGAVYRTVEECVATLTAWRQLACLDHVGVEVAAEPRK